MYIICTYIYVCSICEAHTPQHLNVNVNTNVCLEHTNLLGQMRPLKFWKILDVPQVIMVIATFLATYSGRTGVSLYYSI